MSATNLLNIWHQTVMLRLKIWFCTSLGTVNVLLTTPMWVVNTRLKLQGAKFRNEELHQTHYKGIFGQ